ncbi:hypothetical protein [Streptomyces sp. NPDC048196]|uniref:hypothetical protein n=1 Tax=Streptomyces sp. NPDC048196 TaxID=3154712 RepID=UPI00340A3E9C
MALLVAVERGMRLPSIFDRQTIAAACRSTALKCMERLGVPVALAPEILGAVSEADANRIRDVADVADYLSAVATPP